MSSLITRGTQPLADLGVGEFERPTGLTRNFGDGFAQRFAVEREHALAPGEARAAGAATGKRVRRLPLKNVDLRKA